MIRSTAAGLVLVATAGCSSANLPVSTRFPGIVDRPASARVFVDANGSFYPDGWRTRIDPARIENAGSLLNAATPAQREWINAEDQRQLAQVGAIIAGKRRIFVLVHGYNIGEADAALAFDLLERRIDFRPDDAVIRLHWDGKLGSGIGMGTIWFAAAGTSQVVGIRGLRRLLALAHDQDVYLISHSRGASVVLSALGDPPFDAGFRRGTDRLGFGSFLDVPIAERGNRIQALLLGPAVGYPDFWDKACETRAGGYGGRCADPPTVEGPCQDYRRFTPQLRSIAYTTNRGDRTLGKYAFRLARYFNATDLGHDEEVGERLEHCYPGLIKGYRIDGAHPHAFTLYAQDPEVATMLRDAGVGAR